MVKEKMTEKEREERLKALRRELEEQLAEQMQSLGHRHPEPFAVILSGAAAQGRLREGSPSEILRPSGPQDDKASEPAQAGQVIEALLFASGKPLTVAELRKALKHLSAAEITQAVLQLKEEYAREGRAFEVLEIANGYEISTKKEFAPWVMKLELQRKIRHATQSALETLAILAYKQPVTRAEIEELRGVDVSAVLTTLMERGLIKIVGKKEVPGRPFLYGTTEKFLEHFGLSSLEALPDIQEIKTLVEQSVRKEELLGTTKMVDMPPEEKKGEQAAFPTAGHPEGGCEPTEGSSR